MNNITDSLSQHQTSYKANCNLPGSGGKQDHPSKNHSVPYEIFLKQTVFKLSWKNSNKKKNLNRTSIWCFWGCFFSTFWNNSYLFSCSLEHLNPLTLSFFFFFFYCETAVVVSSSFPINWHLIKVVLFSIPFAVAHLAGLFVNIRHNTGRKHTSTAGSKIIKRASSMLQKQNYVQIFSILGVGNTFQAGHVWHPEELIMWSSALLTGWVTASFPRLLEHSSFFTSVWPHRPRLLANMSRDHANDVTTDAAICWYVVFLGILLRSNCW